MGMVVDYLAKFYIYKQPAELVFDLTIGGSRILGHATDNEKEIKTKVKSILKTLNSDEKLSDDVITGACFLASLETIGRAGFFSYNPNANVVPDEETIKRIRIMVIRTLIFLETKGYVRVAGFKLTESCFTEITKGGDGDFITKDAIWDIKVSKKPPEREHTLKILVYYLMGLRCRQLGGIMEDVKIIGIYNPRLDQSWSYKIKEIKPSIIDEVTTQVIGY